MRPGTHFVRHGLAVLACAAALAGCAQPVSLTVSATGSGATTLSGGTVEILGEGLSTPFGTSSSVTLNTLRFSGWKGIKISAPGYETMYRRIDFVPGKSYTLAVALRAAPQAHHVTLPDPSSGTPLAVNEGIATVTITPGGLVHKDGSTVTGDVDVLIVPFDPVTRQDPPASLLTKGGQRLMSLGMSTITITQDGEEVQPRSGVPLAWQMAVSSSLAPIADPSSYKMWSVDPSTGLWQSEATATVAFDSTHTHFTAQLPHLSVWNLDYAFYSGACIRGHVLDAHNQVSTDPGISISAVDTSVGVSIDGIDAAYTTSSSLGVSSPQFLGDYYWSCDDYYCEGQGNVAQDEQQINLDAGSYFLSVPVLTDAYSSLVQQYGLSELPLQITLNGGIAGQDLYAVRKNGGLLPTSTTQGPISPPTGQCDTIDFQFCYPDGASCGSGDVCCDGQACGSDGKCGGAQCKNTGESCSSASDCCNGQVCTNAVCAPVPTCAAQGNVCGNVTDCCADSKFCAAGHCAACLPTYATGCSSKSDCCTGSCVGGTCLDCQDQGSGCSSSGQCCAGNLCVTPAPGQSASGADDTCESCIPAGHGACTADDQCCDHGLCRNGVCQECSADGGACSATADCCGGFCLDGASCASCVPLEHGCVAGQACCGGATCAYDDKCRVCVSTGNPCATGHDCCSGSCQDNLCQ